jgi:hypothetical protein
MAEPSSKFSIQQFRETVIAHSIAKTYDEAILEWSEPKPYEHKECDGECICGQTGIRNMYVLTRLENDKSATKTAVLWIGCVCAKRVMKEQLRDTCKYCKEVISFQYQAQGYELCARCANRARSKSMSRKTLRFLAPRIPNWTFQWLVKKHANEIISNYERGNYNHLSKTLYNDVVDFLLYYEVMTFHTTP